MQVIDFTFLYLNFWNILGFIDCFYHYAKQTFNKDARNTTQHDLKEEELSDILLITGLYKQDYQIRKQLQKHLKIVFNLAKNMQRMQKICKEYYSSRASWLQPVS